MFDSSATTYGEFPYFHRPTAVSSPRSATTPTRATGPIPSTVAHWLFEIVGALLGAGLRLDELREYPFTTWKAFPFLLEDGERFVMPPDRPSVPLTFSIRASKP